MYSRYRRTSYVILGTIYVVHYRLYADVIQIANIIYVVQHILRMSYDVHYDVSFNIHGTVYTVSRRFTANIEIISYTINIYIEIVRRI